MYYKAFSDYSFFSIIVLASSVQTTTVVALIQAIAFASFHFHIPTDYLHISGDTFSGKTKNVYLDQD